MVKSIIKEIIIILLLLLAVVLAMGVLFYDYIPSNKTVPSVSKYKTSDSVTTELSEQITESETVLVTYQVTADDLKNLEKNNDYNRGKQNPFSTYEESKPTEDENNVTSVQGNVPSANSSTNTTTNTNSNTFYKNTGTK